MNKKVAVVILNYKVKAHVLACLKSVQKSSLYPQDIEIIIVDNNSGDGLESELPSGEQMFFIQTNQNLGYTGGNNVGIKKAITLKPDYILVLNPDTTIDPKAIEILLKTAQTEQAGIVGPKIYFSGSKKIWYAGGILDTANVLGGHRGVDEIDTGKYDAIGPTDYVTGAAMLVNREVFEKIGLFDERYFLYYEDSDLCLRARKAGFKVLYVPKAVVYHDNAQSTGLGSPLQDYFITRNRLLFAQKHFSVRTQFALFREALRNLRSKVRRQALIDFIIGNLGKGNLDKVLKK